MNELNFNDYKNIVEKRLSELLDIKDANQTIIEAMNYSVSAGGKRLRPVLNLMANSLLDGDIYESLDNACAIEFIHTYSLIHDDLPAMDNDDLRRGKPTNHVMFGEAFAILAGDGLLNFAFETMLNNVAKHIDKAKQHIKAVNIIAKNAGIYGMIGGQCADIENEGQIITQKELDYIHKHKTSAMIEGALLSGLVLADPSDNEYAAIETYGKNIGLTFQIIDDILDITSSSDVLGKTIGKDAAAHKITYPVLYGIDKSFSIAREKTDEAVAAIEIFGKNAKGLTDLANTIINRKN